MLDYPEFQASVMPVLNQFSCNTAECHGGGIRGTYQLSPVDAPNPAYDFEQTRLQVDPYDPSASPLLRKPLAVGAGGELHSWEPFASTDDPAYRAAIRKIGSMGYTYDAMVYHPQLSELAAVARACPETPIVIDHLGGILGTLVKAPF